MEPTKEHDAARLERENEELARGVLDLTRRLTVAEQRTKHAEELAERSMKDAGLWRRGAVASERWRLKYTMAEGAMDALSEFFLPLAYFPAGEEPGARWGLTDLGQAAVNAGRAKGPEWTLLLSPDPREVLSIEVRTGSRQETTYRMAGYVTAEEPDFQGGHFLGLLEAFTEVVMAQDEVMGRAMAALEKLFLYGVHEKAAVWLERMEGKVNELLASRLPLGREHLDCNASPDPEAGAPPYDLAAICARCSRPYGDHILPLGPECDGFLAEAT